MLGIRVQGLKAAWRDQGFGFRGLPAQYCRMQAEGLHHNVLHGKGVRGG